VDILTKVVREGTTEYVRGSAATALGRLASPKAAEALRELLEDEKAPDTTRAFVAVALGLVLDRQPVPILSRIGDHLNQRMTTEAVAEVLTFL
jgi:HEAT repeat protein